MTGNHYYGVMDAAGQSTATGDAEFPRPVDDPTDDQLLTEYFTKRDESAFAVLVHRHGPLVWRVCRRVLGPSPDAEDAFQATFVVLIRKANAVRWKTSIAGWLYQVAHRVALRSRARIARRAAALADSRSHAPARLPDASDDDRCGTIEEEIARLPESLRLPVVMCYIQGLTNSEAASRIGCPEGTVASRLARARSRLRRRLRARGIAVVGAAALVEALSTGASASVAAALEKSTIAIVSQAASASTATGVLSITAVRLGQEVARQMSRQRLVQCGAAILAGTAIVGSLVVFSLGLWSAEREPDVVSVRGTGNSDTMTMMNPQMGQIEMRMMPANPGPNVVMQKLNATIEALQGNWPLDEWQVGGESMTVSPEEQRLEFAGDRCLLVNITRKPGPVIAQAIFDAQDPGHIIDFIVDPDDEPYRVLCIYELVGDTLRLSMGYPDALRPATLNSARGDRHHFFVFKRPRAAAASEPPPSPD
jgi:RNA polymerase sigma factor (sigma-70 family)